MASKILPIVARTPVLAGVCGTDPFRHIPSFLKQLKELGVLRRAEFPDRRLVRWRFRQNLEETGMGYSLEAVAMAEAGADTVVIYLGLTTKGKLGETIATTLEESVKAVQEIADAAKRVEREGQEEVIVLVHGGPVAEREDAEFVLNRTTGVKGLFGASSLER
ncbi:TIM-barrel signal transduction protein-domain-containing protein [Sphaerosporella brunnea]|uniref:TIM-barrel signal transduction protein-domain-containing protein n=1 Tax=Sphaerosporella brunnea TaxID=1250544 RepID=A0A5J5EFQ8_9PEZI|nr:TIM-barrel signal transduction protein-domain-containing protein [Sphaerosporella brunnea]